MSYTHRRGVRCGSRYTHSRVLSLAGLCVTGLGHSRGWVTAASAAVRVFWAETLTRTGRRDSEGDGPGWPRCEDVMGPVRRQGCNPPGPTRDLRGRGCGRWRTRGAAELWFFLASPILSSLPGVYCLGLLLCAGSDCAARGSHVAQGPSPGHAQHGSCACRARSFSSFGPSGALARAGPGRRLRRRLEPRCMNLVHPAAHELAQPDSGGGAATPSLRLDGGAEGPSRVRSGQVTAAHCKHLFTMVC